MQCNVLYVRPFQRSMPSLPQSVLYILAVHAATAPVAAASTTLPAAVAALLMPPTACTTCVLTTPHVVYRRAPAAISMSEPAREGGARGSRRRRAKAQAVRACMHESLMHCETPRWPKPAQCPPAEVQALPAPSLLRRTRTCAPGTCQRACIECLLNVCVRHSRYLREKNADKNGRIFSIACCLPPQTVTQQTKHKDMGISPRLLQLGRCSTVCVHPISINPHMPASKQHPPTDLQLDAMLSYCPLHYMINCAHGRII
jgi:hypothetical protein